MHDLPGQRGSVDFSQMSPSIMGSPLSQALSEQQLSPLASPFPDPNPFRVPMYEGVNARPFSPPGFAPNFLGFQDFAQQGF